MHSKHIIGIVGVLAVSLGLPAVVHAGGDSIAAEVQSLACRACHVSEAVGDAPHLAGQREGYVARQLKAFKAGDRKNALMNAITGPLSDVDIANLAAFWSRQAAGSDTAVSSQVAAIIKPKMVFPREFPEGFVLVVTTNKEDRHLLAKTYVNTVAFQAAKAGKPLPDGSAIIVMNYAPKLDADKQPIADQAGTWLADRFKFYEGMEARAGWGNDIPELLRDANWSYAVFGPDKAVRTEANQAVCLACHKRAAATGFVFDLKKIQAGAGATKRD
jgi:cytochrome c553